MREHEEYIITPHEINVVNMITSFTYHELQGICKRAGIKGIRGKHQIRCISVIACLNDIDLFLPLWKIYSAKEDQYEQEMLELEELEAGCLKEQEE